jgi:peptide/nickel transport system permease protein
VRRLHPFGHGSLTARPGRGGTGRAVIAVSGAIVLLVTLAALLAPVISPYDPDAQTMSLSLNGPGASYLLGTDKLGRDTFSRLLWGARTTLLSALFVVLLSTTAGVVLGLLSGYYEGPVDLVVSRSLDILLAFPALLLALIIVAAFGRGVTNAVVALSIVYVPMIARLVRSSCLVEKRLPYVEAARALGYSDLRIMFRHILPNVVPLLLVQAPIDFGYSILDLASLSFLGLGVQPPKADWGAMLAEGRDYLLLAPRLAIVPGLAIMVIVVAFNLLGDGLRTRLERAGGGG